jgi:hypothetical protein
MKSAFDIAMERAERPVPSVPGASYHRRAMGFNAYDAYKPSGEYAGSAIGFGRAPSKKSGDGDCRSIGFLSGRAA